MSFAKWQPFLVRPRCVKKILLSSKMPLLIFEYDLSFQ